MPVDPDEYVARANASTGGGTASGTTASPRVFLGSRSIPQSKGTTRTSPFTGLTYGTGRELTNESKDETLDEAAARNLVYAWYGTSKYTDWAKRLVELGIIDAADQEDVNVLSEAWNDAVDLSMNLTAGGRKTSPWDAAAILAKSNTYGARGSAGFSGTKSATSRSVDLTDPNTAKAIVNDALSQYLGRAATPEELTALRGVLAAAEQANPTVTNSSTTYSGGEAVSQSSTTSGGLSGAGKQQVIADEAMKKPEYGAVQAATTYYNALLSAIQSPV